jgi:hypothetical protein
VGQVDAGVFVFLDVERVGQAADGVVGLAEPERLRTVVGEDFEVIRLLVLLMWFGAGLFTAEKGFELLLSAKL